MLGYKTAVVRQTAFHQRLRLVDKRVWQRLATRQREQQNPIEQLGPKLRAMMPFLQPVIAPGLENKAAASKK